MTSFSREFALEPSAAAAPGFREAFDCAGGGMRFRCHLARFSPGDAGAGLPGTDAAIPASTLVVLVHGCGCTSASWSAMMQRVAAQAQSGQAAPAIFRRDVTFAAFDMRGHGETRADGSLGGQSRAGGATSSESPSADSNLDMSNLASDTIAVTMCLAQWVRSKAEIDAPVNVVLVGHSLGGAVAVRAAERYLDGAKIGSPNDETIRIVGVTVVDIVEGTAIPSLKMLPALLKSRPSEFASPRDAVEWTLSAGMCNNPASAAISVPAMLQQRQKDGRFEWRTNIEKTSRFWRGWYTGLSAAFLRLPSRIGKSLVLASTDRLDKQLTIGHMQGKFQFNVVQTSATQCMRTNRQRWLLLLKFLGRIVVGVRGLD